MPLDVVKELDRVLASDQHDPFRVLGFHIVDPQKPTAIIRTFQPLAESVRLVMDGQKTDMYKMREEGLFETIINDFREPVDYCYELTQYNQVIKMVDAKTGQIISISFLILNAVGAILPVVLLEPLSGKIGRNKTQGLVVGIMAVAYLVIALFVRSEYMLYVMMAFAGIGWAGIVSLPFASMSETVDKSRMGFFMGLFNMSIVIPQLIVSLVFGTIILNSSNKEMVFLIAAVTVALSSLLWFFVKDKKH